MKLVPLLSYHATLGEAHDIGAVPTGHRFIVEVTGGAFEGEKLKGTISSGGGADWLHMTDDFGHLDVRATFITDDGAKIYVEYFGKLELTENVQAALAGNGECDYGEQYFVTSPRMQTGDERYKWLNNIICVAQGRLKSGQVEYNVFQVTND
ncbi:MAG: DUF3237 domain-containing protein [Pseudomonadota bacterium]